MCFHECCVKLSDNFEKILNLNYKHIHGRLILPCSIKEYLLWNVSVWEYGPQFSIFRLFYQWRHSSVSVKAGWWRFSKLSCIVSYSFLCPSPGRQWWRHTINTTRTSPPLPSVLLPCSCQPSPQAGGEDENFNKILFILYNRGRGLPVRVVKQKMNPRVVSLSCSAERQISDHILQPHIISHALHLAWYSSPLTWCSRNLMLRKTTERKISIKHKVTGYWGCGVFCPFIYLCSWRSGGKCMISSSLCRISMNYTFSRPTHRRVR